MHETATSAQNVFKMDSELDLSDSVLKKVEKTIQKGIVFDVKKYREKIHVVIR